jgi:hypothetical protein
MTLSNIQFSADHAITLYNGDGSEVGTLEADKFLCDNMLGIPCPYVEGALSGFAYNPIVSVSTSFDNKWGDNSVSNKTEFDEILLQAYARFMTKRF